MKFTVFGGHGFIGGHLVHHLRAQGYEVSVPLRDELLSAGTAAGHVIYAIGLTGDFRERVHEAIEAHVTVLSRVLRTVRFDSFLYLSSTRVYGGLPPDALLDENTALTIEPSADATYDLSKLLGESLCLAQAAPSVRIARLSNIVGPGQGEQTFLGALLRQARRAGRVTVREAPESSKDYLSVDDLVPLLETIALRGQQRLYNVASGAPLTHRSIAETIRTGMGAKVDFLPNAPVRSFPRIDITRIRDEFNFKPRPVLEYLASLAEQTT